MPSASVSPEKILEELSDLWITMAAPEDGADAKQKQGSGVLRACALTLITVMDESEDAQNVGETLALLMRDHPSRAIVIRLSGSSDILSSRVFAQCWKPFGHTQQICCEEIEITVSDNRLPDVAGVVLPLAVPDLPVIAWCRSVHLFDSALFGEIVGLAPKVIVDSSAFPDSRNALSKILAQCGRPERFIADLSWARITRWRETIGQIFENRRFLAELCGNIKVRVTYPDGRGPTPEAQYLAAWLVDCLGEIGARASAEWDAVKAERGTGLVAVSLESATGSCRVSLAREAGSGMVEVQVDESVSHVVFPEPTDAELLREELSITGRDPVYEHTLRSAVRMTEAKQ